MKIENIETIIRDLFRDNYRAYPESYKGAEKYRNAKVCAIGFWQNRTEDEINRDKEAEVVQDDYTNWVLNELVIQEKQPA